jgi:hypothetical protein
LRADAPRLGEAHLCRQARREREQVGTETKRSVEGMVAESFLFEPVD